MLIKLQIFQFTKLLCVANKLGQRRVVSDILPFGINRYLELLV